jgi:hypothetical protein
MRERRLSISTGRKELFVDCDDLRCLRALIVGVTGEAGAVLARQLEACGFECAEAADGMDALRYSSDVGIDLVVAAREMPRLGCGELLSLIDRGLYGSKPPPVLLWDELATNHIAINLPGVVPIRPRCDIGELRAALERAFPAG